VPIYIVERLETKGPHVALGRLGPSLPDLAKLAYPYPTNAHRLVVPEFAEYIGRVKLGISNPTYGSECLHISDPEFGCFGVRFYEAYDMLTTWTLATWSTSSVSEMAVRVSKKYPLEDKVLRKEEINQWPVGLMFRCHPKIIYKEV